MDEDLTKQLPHDGVQRILARFDSIDNRLNTLDARLDSLDARLNSLEEKVERRLMETRPIWEQVLNRLEGLEVEMARGFKRLERQMSLLAKDVIEVRSDQADLDRRLDKFELDHAT